MIYNTLEAFRNEILLACEKDLNVEVILIYEFNISEIRIQRFRNKDHFNI